MTPMGPFETEREAHAAALEFAGIPAAGSILSEDQRRIMLIEACQAAGVDRGMYDDRIVRWLAGWDDATVAVVAGLITRAYEAGKREAKADG